MKTLAAIFLGFIFILGIIEFFEICLTIEPILYIMLVAVAGIAIYQTRKG